MTSDQIRQSFLDFFEKKGHTIVPSAPVIPHGDPTLLFTNAGMNQFKDVFLGEGSRGYTRAADTQKCLRVSGKHNDLEEVGYDTYHHTLFEMLGNWSFGDYYKREAIAWAWELLTEVWNLNPARLYATVFETDEESEQLWKEVTSIEHSHILRFGAKDNFWEMGETGPCGPCSEIHYDKTPDRSGAPLVNMGSPEVVEIWNLVFIEFNRTPDGVLQELPTKHVDTGSGFERVAAVLQGKPSNYDTDIFAPYLAWLSMRSGIPYGSNEESEIAMRVIADHIRALTCAVADGALPGNEGRGYVLRRILRRAARYGRKLGLKDPFLNELSLVVGQTMGSVFPELRDRAEHVQRVLRGEEESFNMTLDRGLALFDEVAEIAKSKGEITGGQAFKLYDTFGFPIDLTDVLARERNLRVNMEDFTKLLKEQKDRSLSVHASKKRVIQPSTASSDLTSEFTGYKELSGNATALAVDGNSIILDKTPFYAESGGQVSDTGNIIIDGRSYRVADVRKLGGAIAHLIEADSIEAEEGDTVEGAVDQSRRFDIMRNHTATHLLHAALRQVLGDHVHQSGSLVNDEHLRFDFAHFQKVSPIELKEIEALVNEKIREAIPLHHHLNIPFEEAKKMGAMMFFGDKYGERVNVVDFGPFSREFCGGTHVQNTSQIGLFKFTHEGSIASGVRRIEAVTGKGVEHWLASQETKYDELSRQFEELQAEKQRLERDITKVRLDSRREEMRALITHASMAGAPVKYVAQEIAVLDADELKALGEILREIAGAGFVGLLGAKLDEEKVSLVAVVSDDLIKEKKLSAGKLVSSVAELVGGKGGGRPQIAQAGGREPHNLAKALAALPGLLRVALHE